MDWGDSLIQFASTSDNIPFFYVGGACIKQSLIIDPDNQYAKKRLQWLNNNDNISVEKLASIPSFTNEDLKNIIPILSKEQIITSFDKIKNIDNKVKLAVYLGETGDKDYFELLKYCILTSQDMHVVFAALKRIHNFETYDIKPVFEGIIEKGTESYEPYFTIALTRINRPWAEEFLKQHGTNIATEEAPQTIVTQKIDDELKAILLISFSKFKVDEIEKQYNEKNSKILAYYLTNGMKDSGIEKIMKSGIITLQGQFTEAGWELIKEYLIAAKSAYAEKTTTSHTPSKWWQFWK